MAEIEITLPTVQYGNVKVRATPEELGIPDLSNADQVGIVAAVYLNLFTQGFKTGSQMDVSAPLPASQSEPDQPADEVDVAAQIVTEGLGATEVLDDEAEDARVGGAPWNAAPVDAKPKPWETGHTTTEAKVSPVVLDAAW